MKVLWVCNTMIPVIAEHFGLEASNKEGWITGLCMDLMNMEKKEEKPAYDPEDEWLFAGISQGPEWSSSPEVITLAVAVPWQGDTEPAWGVKIPVGNNYLLAYGYRENLVNPDNPGTDIVKEQLAFFRKIDEEFQPDVIHCFGTEYCHSRILVEDPERSRKVLLGIQGLCSKIAEAYMADLPRKVIRSRTFRDRIRKDSLLEQQAKFTARGITEKKTIEKAVNVAGRTSFDQLYVTWLQPAAKYFVLNETLRPCFYEGQWEAEKARPATIFVSQGDYPLKGLHTAIMAVGKLKKDYPDVQLRVAGNSLTRYTTLKDKLKISAYGKYLRKLIRKEHLEKNVVFLGRLTAEEMKQQYLECSVFLCCSSCENSPNSLGEAMILGVPCVTALVGGIPDLFRDGVDGKGYEGWKAERSGADGLELEWQARDIAKSITSLWKDPDKTLEYCRNAREHALQTHDRENNLRALLDIYFEIAVNQDADGE